MKNLRADRAYSQDTLGRKQIQQDRMKVHFIRAMEEHLRREGIENITLRKVANTAGYSSATLYSYFENLDDLILFGSMRYFKQYAKLLKEASSIPSSTYESYLRIFSVFCDITFSQPEIFFNLFFKQDSCRVTNNMIEYYRLFPDELYPEHGDIRKLMMQGNVYERDLVFIKRMAAEGVINPRNIDCIVKILGAIQESSLFRLSNKRTEVLEIIKEETLSIVRYVINTGAI